MLSELRTRKLTYLFHCFDADNNGILERSDYEKFVENLTDAFELGMDSAKHATIRAETLALWEFVRTIADHDGDNRVSCDEFVTAYAALCDDDIAFHRLLMGYATFVIETGDRDGTGYLDIDEYTSILSCYGIAPDDARDAFRKISLTDGQLSLADMGRAFEEYFRSDDPEAPGNWMMGPF